MLKAEPDFSAATMQNWDALMNIAVRLFETSATQRISKVPAPERKVNSNVKCENIIVQTV
jgi:hypothetical protein